MQGQKKLFDQILTEKEGLIGQFKDELDKRDEDYNKMLKQQSKDIEDIVKLMNEQFKTLRIKYLEELKHIEEEFK